MKHLKRFNESNSGSGNASFDWLKSQNNEKYFELVDILQSNLFDDFDVYSATTENFDDEDNKPRHKFWLYQVDGKLVYPKDLNGVISSIFVYNIGEEEHEEFFEALKGLKVLIEDVIGKELGLSEEAYVDDYDEVYDVIIKLI